MIRAALVTLATLRVTRVITTDWIGAWTLRWPAEKWADTAERRAHFEEWKRMPAPRPPFEHWTPADIGPRTWQGKLVKGLSCPFCVGFWIGGAVLLFDRIFQGPWAMAPGKGVIAGNSLSRQIPVLGPLWLFAMAALALNYITGHIGARVDE